MKINDIVIDKITSMRGWDMVCQKCGKRILKYPEDEVCPYCGAAVHTFKVTELPQLSSLSCPFCGGSVNILPCDDEGSLKNEEQGAGFRYFLNHSIYDVPGRKHCPIATLDRDEMLGGLIYASRENAVKAWKKRELG